jgi:Xaa-Pro aminopeptidase
MTTISTPSGELGARRSSVFESLGDGVMVLPSAPVQHTSRDTERPYAPDRELFYLSGLAEPDCVAVLVGGSDPRLELFARSRDADAELWSGPRLGLEGVQSVSGAEEVYPIQELASRLPTMLGGADRIHVRLGRSREVDDLVIGALGTARARGPRLGSGPRGVIDPGEILDELRLLKSAHEVETIRNACRITMEGHRAAARALAEGVGEWVVEAALERAFRAAGAIGPGFASIVGGGENACILHYVANDATIPEGGLVLIDAGAEYGLYHGDVTRTFPASGRFSGTQRAVYEIVDEARRAAIAAVRPGATIGDVHEASTRVLALGLLDLGVLSGDVDEVVDAGGHREFFPHQTSHWLGLDVHDPGDYQRRGASRMLEAGMVFTVEPGLYFRPESGGEGMGTWSGIGVRIEDDVLVTGDGAEVMTTDLPTAIDEVEGRVGR